MKISSMTNPNIAFAFRQKTDLLYAKQHIESEVSDLKTKITEQILADGYSFVLFVENKHSLNFNLYLLGIVSKYGGVLRDSVRI